METHQLDVEHLQTIHDHETDHSPQLDKDKDNEHDIEDCVVVNKIWPQF